MLIAAFGTGIVAGIFVMVAFSAIKFQNQSEGCVLTFAALVLLLFALMSLGVLFMVSMFELMA